jgi:hypothetical protein
MLAMVFGLIAAMPALAGPSETPASSPAEELGVEVLSLSLSKLPRDDFGNVVNPFSGMGFNQGEAGTVVFARITPRLSSSLVLQTGKCRLLSFKDDVGTDLFTNAPAGMGDGIFSGNRPLEILAGADRGILGIKTRSARLPARAATRLTAEVLLVFGRTSEERVEQKGDVLLQTQEVVTVGPLKVKFKEQAASSYYRTNQAAAGSSSTFWMASFLPEKDVAIASVAFFSEKSDEPILSAKNVNAEGNASSANTGAYSSNRDAGGSAGGFAKAVGYGFRPPDDRKISIKVRYYDVGSLVEKRCVISTGLSP